jgi:hypothetical protein
MNVVLPLEKMSKEEKLLIMEQIWEDLSRNADNMEVPEWHLDVLKDRELSVDKGLEQFIPWEEAKKRLREKHS